MPGRASRASCSPSIAKVIEQLSVRALRRYYGSEPHQYGDLHVSRADPEKGVIVLFHGGFWRAHRDLSMTTAMAQALANEGWNVWNVEYRRAGQHGWRRTLADCAAATDHVAVLVDELGLDSSSVLLVGHSAGGHLAAWVAGRDPRAGGPLTVSGLVTLNGVLDLRRAANDGVGDDAVLEFLGALPESRPDVYEAADPMARLPLGVPVRCLHSRTDERVPFELSEGLAAAGRRAGDDARLVEIPDHHTAPIEVGSEAWRTVVATIDALRPAAVGLS